MNPFPATFEDEYDRLAVDAEALVLIIRAVQKVGRTAFAVPAGVRMDAVRPALQAVEDTIARLRSVEPPCATCEGPIAKHSADDLSYCARQRPPCAVARDENSTDR